ncbi:MAG: 3'-5' exonuclease domain-containing protein 2 [Puniceicoccales bacterium]|jgi:ribonuclease D|nr:3'-5' exonuclease domain-containing protein 2 [Puniceicoccales bacterium]
MLGKLLRSIRDKIFSFNKSISKAELAELPLFNFNGEIILVESPQEAERMVDLLLKHNVLGFDTESKPAFRKGESYSPSLVQISTDKTVYLFKLAKINGIKSLIPLLESQDVKKVGIAIRDDINKLKELGNFEDAGFVDISDLTKILGIENTGLRTLAGIFLRYRISKSLQVTDWSKEILSKKQIIYAATDAWVSRELFMKVKEFTSK